MLLLTPHASFFGLTLDARFLFLTASAHVVFWVALGWFCRWTLDPPARSVRLASGAPAR